jgi:predicted LPLAT superfamily acyltransferase
MPEEKAIQWKGKSRGGNFGYWFFIVLLKSLGLGFAYFFLRFIVIYFVIFAPKASKAQYKYFREIHKWPFGKSIISLIRNYYVFGQVILDKVALMAGVKTNFTYNFDGEEYLHQLAKEKKGVLLVGAHFGNWEIAGQLLHRINTKVHIIMLDAENEKIKKLINKNTEARNFNVIPIKSDMSHLALIKKAFDNNEFVAMHGDRFLEGAKSISCNFMGKTANFPTGPFYMAMKYGIPITYVSAVKETNTHYHFFATEPRMYKNFGKPKMRDAEVKKIVQLYIQNLEGLIKKYPLQWFNYYEFWK